MKEKISRGRCSVCGHNLSGGQPCLGGVKIELVDEAKAVMNDGLALQYLNIAGGTEESITEKERNHDNRTAKFRH